MVQSVELVLDFIVSMLIKLESFSLMKDDKVTNKIIGHLSCIL